VGIDSSPQLWVGAMANATVRQGWSVGEPGGKVKKHTTPQRTLIVQPDDGIDAVLRLVTAATKSLRVKQFTLSEPRLVQAIIDAHHRGVAVRVMMNPHRSSGDRANDLTFAQLQKTGMAVQWTSPDLVVTHEKSIVVDDARALIATFNLVLKYWLIVIFDTAGEVA
jgi:phosphatidylserine/phosphatidylglycerophosphate/cardiolipin synthase-like enzyme